MTASHSLFEPSADAMLGRAAARRLFGRMVPVNGHSTCLGSMTHATRRRGRPFGRCSWANRQ